EVHGTHEDAGVEVVADADLGVVVVGDLGAGDAGGDQPLPVRLQALGRDVEGDVVHGPHGAGELPLVGPGPRGGHAGHGVGGVREPEEGEGVAPAAVE